jgi:hypothetical protein
VSSRVSLAELIDSDIPIRPDEAVAILCEVCRQYTAGDLHGIPNATVIRLTPDARVLVEGPVSRDQDTVQAAAMLLADLLPGFDTRSGFKVPGGLRLLLARATRTIDLPPFADIADFSAALDRFAAPDTGEAVRGLFRSWASRLTEQLPGPSNELTISNVRRARRATGLSLEDVAQTSGISVASLRELEWGYLRNWRAGDDGRDDLLRYARAAGLDEDLVLSVAWPLVQSAAEQASVDQQSPDLNAWTALPAPETLVPVLRRQPMPPPTPGRLAADRYRWALALGAGAMIVVTSFAMGWEGPSPDGPVAETKTTELESRPAAPLAAPLIADAPRLRLVERPTSYERPAAPRHSGSKAKPRPPAPTQPPPAPPHKSFFKRELFRIVIKK